MKHIEMGARKKLLKTQNTKQNKQFRDESNLEIYKQPQKYKLK